jgi:hypothetical protein
MSEWKVYESPVEGPTLMGFKGTSVMGMPILTEGGETLKNRDDLKVGFKFFDPMFGHLCTVKRLGHYGAAEPDDRSYSCGVEYNEEQQCWWVNGYICLSNTSALKQEPVVISEEATESCVPLDVETFVPRKGILTRYGKKLLREGAKYYSRKSVSDSLPTVENDRMQNDELEEAEKMLKAKGDES